MALYLVQHGKNLPKGIDPDKGLSSKGFSDVKRIADVAKGYNVRVSCIKHSGKKRAKQTAEIFALALKPEKGVRKSDGLDPMDDVSCFAEKINNSDNLMLVGHLPFMERLATYLITGSVDRPVFKFQNGGIVSMDIDPGSHFWVIKWALMPEIG